MSDRRSQTSNIRLRTRTEVECVEGSGHVERVVLKSLDDGTSQVKDVDAVFVFIGTKPLSDWLPANVRATPRTRAPGRSAANHCPSRPACPVSGS
jgi:thioredoxin reductase (NADPH)